jgi:beta-lactamase class A
VLAGRYARGWLPAAVAATALSGALVAIALLGQYVPTEPLATRPSPPEAPPSPVLSPSPSPIPALAEPSATPQPAPDPTVAVQASIASYVTGRRAHAGIAVRDRITGLAVAYQETVRFDTASVVKANILAALLWRNQRANRSLTAAQGDLAEDMIVHSDNDATDALWDAAGGAAGITNANQAFGLSQTSVNQDGYWGATLTTAADQLRLLGALADLGGPLSTISQGYEWNLLAHVDTDQRWGVPRAAGPAATAVYVKNGWLDDKNDRGRWIMNTVGRIVEPGHDWLVAILSDHNPTEQSGMTLVETLAAIALDGLRRATAVATPAPSAGGGPPAHRRTALRTEIEARTGPLA